MTELIRTEEELYVPEHSIIFQEIRKLTQRVAFAIRDTINSTSKYSPGQLVFNRDMIMHQKELINWDRVRERRRKQQVLDNTRENRSGTNYAYEKGDRVLIIKRTYKSIGKFLDFKHEGPYEFLRVFKNGTLRIQLKGFQETLSILRLKLYK